MLFSLLAPLELRQKIIKLKVMLKLFYSHISIACFIYFISVGLPVSVLSEIVSENLNLVNSLKETRSVDKIARVNTTNNLIEKVSNKEFKEIDYTPANEKSAVVLSKSKDVETVKFQEIAKPAKTFSAVIKVKNSITTDRVANKKNIEPIQVIRVNTYELSFKDIDENNQNPMNTQKMNIKKIAWAKISFLDTTERKLAATTKKNNKEEDRISTTASATEEAPEKSTSDELVFFNLNEDGKVSMESEGNHTKALMDESLVDVPRISERELVAESVPELIMATPSFMPGSERVINQKQKALVSTKNKGTQKTSSNASSSIAANLSADKIQMADAPPRSSSNNIHENKTNGFLQEVDNDYACLQKNEMTRESYTNEYSVVLRSINSNNILAKNEFDKIFNFEIRFQDDLDEIVQDYGKGVARLNYSAELNENRKLSSNMNTRRGVISARNHYSTVIDFVFEGLDTQFSIPLFEIEKFNNLVQAVGVSALGSQILVELDELTEDVELDVDTKFEAKLFLDSSLNIVDRADAEFSYIMFLGVTPGNTIINFRNSKGRVTNKIIHLSPKDIYYEPNFYAEVPSDKMSLYEEGLRSKCIGMLDINEEKIKPWSFPGKIVKESLNAHTINEMLYPLGTRKYFDFTHFEKSIFVGRWSEENIILPTKEYANNILNEFEIEDEECMVQLNLVKPVSALYVTGLSETGFMNTDVRYLDQNGNFYRDISSKTDRVFVAGEEQGLINIKLEYTDGSRQFIQTYCSKNTYLVEQL